MASVERTKRTSKSGPCRSPGQHSPEMEIGAVWGGTALRKYWTSTPAHDPQGAWPGQNHCGYSYVFSKHGTIPRRTLNRNAKE